VAVGCVVVAAGRGERLGAGPKAFVSLEGRTLLGWACAAAHAAGITNIVVVVPAQPWDAAAPEILDVPADVVRVAGGATRQLSVAAGLAVLGDDVDIVLVHDAARALTPPSVFVAVVAAVRAGHQAVVPGVAVPDTLRLLPPDRGVVHRDRLVAVQTPQGFDRDTIDRAHAQASPGVPVTDDAGLAELAGATVHVVAGHEEGFKVTRPLDLLLARAVVHERAAAALSAETTGAGS